MVAVVGGAVVVGGVVGGALVLADRTPPPTSQKVQDYLATASATTAKTKAPGMAVVGDSYSIAKTDGWFRRTSFCTRHSLAFSGVAGSGFVNPGESVPFGSPTRISAVTESSPDIVIFQTAYGDSAAARRDPALVEQATVDTINAYKKVAPKAKYVILGPFAPAGVNTSGIPNNLAALKAAAERTGATHISGLSWLPTPDLLGATLKQPNDKGHRRITAHLVDSLKAKGLIESTGGCGLKG